jgi:hypothetical protein
MRPALADHPPLLVSACQDDVEGNFVLLNWGEEPQKEDLKSGNLANTQYPDLKVRPSVELTEKNPATGQRGNYEVKLKIGGIIPFGESSASLFYKDKPAGTLRFFKPGLIPRFPAEGGIVVRQNDRLLLILENPSEYEYRNVRARLRFENADVCSFGVEQITAEGKPERAKLWLGEKFLDRLSDWFARNRPSSLSVSKGECADSTRWTEFHIPRYAQVSLRSDTQAKWFEDPQTGFAKSGKHKGWLTLRFQGKDKDNKDIVFEQNVPLEFQFEPSSMRLFWSILYVFLFLFIGASFSLGLRIWVPNLKRKRQIKDQITEAAKETKVISNEVSSMLRVKLGVKRLNLDELARVSWPAFPAYSDFAQRAEQGLIELKRRIEMTQRLDVALGRKKLLVEQGVAPTRLEQIEKALADATEALMRGQLVESDWVFISQALEYADKNLREPAKQEKEAFEGMLVQRWETIQAHFDKEGKGLKIPPVLEGMEACLPPDSILPKEGDGTKWVKSIGSTRADLQLSALEQLRELEFLAPTSGLGKVSQSEKEEICRLLAAPTIENLKQVRLFLRQFAKGIFEEDIREALRRGDAEVTADPIPLGPNEKCRFAAHFHREDLNSAAARELVTCEWRFFDETSKGYFARQWARKKTRDPEMTERGWQVCHYFASGVKKAKVSVNFYGSNGEAILLHTAHGNARNWPDLYIEPTESKREKKDHKRDKHSRNMLEFMQFAAALLVPLAPLAVTTATQGTAGDWWTLLGIGFGSDTIKNILVGMQDRPSPKPAGQ